VDQVPQVTDGAGVSDGGETMPAFPRPLVEAALTVAGGDPLLQFVAESH
jgi:hypothetical protein